MDRKKLRIAVTGANGQLGLELKQVSLEHPDMEFLFFTRNEWDIAIESLNEERISEIKPDAVINAAAYTNVEKAEEDHEGADASNNLGVGYLAKACKSSQALLVHVSTDYVFDGQKTTPYSEFDEVNPINYYGLSKLQGERAIDAVSNRYFILRTSWLYSSFGHNFFKTMLRLAHEKGALSVVSDQVASPTYARYLAEDIITLLKHRLMEEKPIPYGIYHYTQLGEASWYDFAKEIMKANHLDIPVTPVNSAQFPTKAKRPAYSKLDTQRWEFNTRISLRSWQEGVLACTQAFSLR
jgi:dTDP-4-dehydrorhamnose reductase